MSKLRFVARAPRSTFGRICKWAFFGFQILMVALALGNCSLVLPYIAAEDPEVATGAGMFGTLLAAGLTVAWPLGTVVLGLAALLTRGRRMVIEQDAPPG